MSSFSIILPFFPPVKLKDLYYEYQDVVDVVVTLPRPFRPSSDRPRQLKGSAMSFLLPSYPRTRELRKLGQERG